ncbi:ATP-dependent RNA helicase DBP1 [Pseudocercospora fuligena]|uniref:RNA helicase n=1 Tax=Pseudocercospora fuligena TaxID=685502 RepID=A0A8H6VIG0_9PEZI|nr:ATP-dependent RNA helicase DBP1 [Pseudocercospora fuligena]
MASTTSAANDVQDGFESTAPEVTPVDNDAAAAKAADYQRARDAGWTETVAFDYDEFQRTGGNDGNWLGQAAVYEWSGDYGDVAPSVPELEKVLFGTEHKVTEGSNMKNLDLTVSLEGPSKVTPIQRFDDGGLHPVVLDNIKRCGYDKPTPIQAYTIPAVKLGHDVVGIAQTGSGKTAAFLIPIISGLMGKAKKLQAPRPDTLTPGYNPQTHKVRAEPLVLIIVPTRELAIQVFDEARRLCYRSMLRPSVAYGGLPMRDQISDLGKGCDILVGTPGRLKDLMSKPDILSLSRVKYTVIDEADEMLHEDWSDELNMLMAGGDTNEDADHVYMMFSATFPGGARQLARQYMEDQYLRVRVGRAGQAHKNIIQEIVYVDQDMKPQAVYDLLFKSKPARTLIFCNSRIAVDKLDDYLYNKGLPTTSIHSERNQREREDSLRNFRTGRTPILIATAVSARGWDIPSVMHVINYDLPSSMHGGIQEYVHRIGRTARIGNQGLATSFYNDRNEDLAQDLVNVLVECEQTVPDFLEHLKPEEGANIEFNDNSDDEAEGDDGAGFGSADGGFGSVEGGGFGNADDAPASAWGADGGAGAAPAASGWGAPAETADTGFTADGGAQQTSSW